MFKLSGFKATMVYEKCLVDKNSSLLSIFGHKENIPKRIPPPGSLLNITNGNGTLDNLIMPELPECDLQKELDNVSYNFTFHIVQLQVYKILFYI